MTALPRLEGSALVVSGPTREDGTDFGSSVASLLARAGAQVVLAAPSGRFPLGIQGVALRVTSPLALDESLAEAAELARRRTGAVAMVVAGNPEPAPHAGFGLARADWTTALLLEAIAPAIAAKHAGEAGRVVLVGAGGRTESVAGDVAASSLCGIVASYRGRPAGHPLRIHGLLVETRWPDEAAARWRPVEAAARLAVTLLGPAGELLHGEIVRAG